MSSRPGSGFGDRLRAALDRRGPLCAGIDPHPQLLQAWGCADTPDGLARFSQTAVAALAGDVPVVKPQSAFFERHGARGIAVLEQTVAAAREQGALVLLDVKRGDIGSTAQAYADAYLRPQAPLAVDAVTVHPFLGTGSLDPLVQTAEQHGTGVFVLALTSNPQAPQVQQARTEQGATVAATVLADVARRNRGAIPLGSVGAVVGATIGETGEDLDVGGPLLVPGLGQQGGRPADVRRLFGAVAANVLVSSSRGILGAGPDPAALRAAARRTRDSLTAALGA